MKRIYKFLTCAVLFFAIMHAGMSFAQTAENPATQPAQVNTADVPPAEQSLTPTLISSPGVEALPPEALILSQIERELKEKYKKEIYVPPAIQSLIYTSDQQSLLREARAGFNTRVPAEDETKNSSDTGKGPNDLQTPQQPSVRSISLGGIIFGNSGDWTIWLNKKLVTAKSIPTQAIDLRVYKDYIELRWFDAKTNKIYPIRLRTNQTFNLDAHTFIPG